jgi:outer membrane protein with beta-barrel domain
MKRLTLHFCALALAASASFAGTETYSSKSTVAPAPDCPQWYADTEFNLGLSGIYALTGNRWREDQYLGVDHAWGGSIEAKYFVHRYFGFGIQGNILSVKNNEFIDNGFTRIQANGDDRHTLGSVLGTFTLRYPIGCSRFAPYAWLGGGAIFGGGRSSEILVDPAAPFGIVRRDFNQSDTRGIGQVGGGLEYRFSPHVGLLTDFSWNVVSGSKNNFGMARTGINIAF